MDITAFKSALRSGIVEFVYEKKNGDKRKAIGTLKPDVMKAVLSESKDKDDKPKRKFPSTSVLYYDCEKKALRSFVIDNLISFKPL